MRWNVILRFSDFHAGVCRLRDYSALRASPLRGRPAGVQRRCATLSNPDFLLSGVRIGTECGGS